MFLSDLWKCKSRFRNLVVREETWASRDIVIEISRRPQKQVAVAI